MYSHPLKPRSAWFSVSEAELNPRSERASFPVVTRLVAFPQEANGETLRPNPCIPLFRRETQTCSKLANV
jgi:hypothetical protein